MGRHISSHIIQRDSRTITAQSFFQTLYQHCDGQGCLELRQLPSGRQVFLSWAKEDFEQTIAALTHENVFFGVATRKDSSSGKLVNCEELPALFVDIDFKDTPENKARQQLKNFALLPSIVIQSGNGLHVYWLLKEPLVLDDPGAPERVKSYLRRLAIAVKGDLNAAEPARVLRIPGTLNHKYTPPRRVYIEVCEPDRVYDIPGFDDWLPEDDIPQSQHNECNEDGAIPEGQRNVTLTSLAGMMRRPGMDEEEIDAGLQVINKRRCKPPLDAKTVRTIAASVSRYEPGRTNEDRRDNLDEDKHHEIPFMSYKEGGVHEMNFCPLTALQFVESIEEEEIEWVLEGYLAKGSLVTWVAKPKTGKTTLAYQIVRAVAKGELFLGRETQQGGVLILAIEEHPRDIKLRLQDLGCENATNIYIHCLPTNPTAEFFHHLNAFVKENGIALVVIDTLASFWKLKDENDAAAMTQAVKPLLYLARESGTCVLMIHHSRKSEGAYGDEIRGSSALFGLVDVAVMMRNAEVETQRKLIARSRYPETPTELIIELRDGEYVSLGDPDEVSRKVRLQKMRDALSDTPEKADVIIKRAGLKHRAGQRLLTWLADHKEATKSGDGKKGSPYLYTTPNAIHAGSPSYKTCNESENLDPIHAGGTGGCMKDNVENSELGEVTVYVDTTH